MPNFSGVWNLKEQGVAVKGDRWQSFIDLTGRAVFGGGFSSDYENTLDYITIQSTGNASDFGDLIEARYGICGSSNNTRGLKWQGMPYPGTTNGTVSIDYITIASTGNASDFGDCDALGKRCSALANDTRSVKAGGSGLNDEKMEYVTIASTGNTTNFGDLLDAQNNGDMGGGSNTTRGVYLGNGELAASQNGDRIQYITIASTGNATDFGNLSVLRNSGGSGNSSTRIIFAGGYNEGGSQVADIEYITTATTGNASDFGDLSSARIQQEGASDKLRAVIAGGRLTINIMEYLTMATTGNATDFGDLTVGRRALHSTGISSTHGGLA